ncbi:hypothetical protein, partial [Escherichia coli]|uniref:hypothetical protein n=1 Tax=Escherichia coli TaxID=562 RepID=UPI003C2BBA54
IYHKNCGGNILLDGGSDKSGPTTARFSHMTNVAALDPGCAAPGPGIRIDKNAGAPDNYSIASSIFWDNQPGVDFIFSCEVNCDGLKAIVSQWCKLTMSTRARGRLRLEQASWRRVIRCLRHLNRAT